jgi:hypothetical protein
MHGPGKYKLSLNTGVIPQVDALDKSAGKAVLHAKQDADFLHEPPFRLPPTERTAAGEHGTSVRYAAVNAAPTSRAHETL